MFRGTKVVQDLSHCADSTVEMLPVLQKLWSKEEGQDMVEYALLLGFIVVCAVGIMTGVRTQMSATWSTISSSLSSAVNTAVS
jgi:Flp pilus assembly pilin Flp